ncbi:MAG: FAD-dependent oxidoreductase [Planctomycetota bacterium]
MSNLDNDFDALVLGAGGRGLAAALRLRAAAAASTAVPPRLLVVDAAPAPGGSIRTQRTNGYVCELGPFAFAAADLAPLLAMLPQAPSPLPCLPAARAGWLRTPAGNLPAPVDPEPLTFRTGNEELPQACRRALGPALRLGRPVTAMAPAAAGGGFRVLLGGEVPTELTARSVHVALPAAVAGALLGGCDPALPATANRITASPAAFAFLGGDTRPADASFGYGILAADDLPGPVREAIACSQVFPGRAQPGRCLWRVELAGPEAADADDEALLALAERALAEWTGVSSAFGLRKLHRFAAPVADGALVETAARLRELGRRVPGLVVHL